MSRFGILVTLGALVSLPIRAQWWVDAGLSGYADGVTEMYNDTATNTLYCLGAIQTEIGGPYIFNVYHEGEWTVSDSFDFDVQTACRYHDTLVVGGAFTQINDQNIEYIGAYVNGGWIPYGNFDWPVYALRVLDGELYAVGFFEYVEGNWCGGVAKRVGNAWQPVGNFPVNDYPSVTDAVMYQGNIVVTGTIYFNGLPFNHIIQYDGQNWIPLGQGIQTSMGGGGTLAVYQNELYVGGFFRLSEGNAGHCIMRWDGQAWYPVGTGIQDETGGYLYAVGVKKLLVKDGLLFACGGFQYAGNVPAAFTATWDGDRWCGFGGSMDPNLGATTLGFYGDTLFVGCGNTADGQPVNHLVRYIGDSWGDTCSLPMGDLGMGIADMPGPHEPLQLANLGNGQYRILGEVPQGELRVYDAMGRLQRTFALRTGSDGTEPFSLAGLSSGIYIAQYPGMPTQRIGLFK